jgi:hypothetical protein
MAGRYHNFAKASVTLADLIAPFIGQVASGEVEAYNEFSSQHDLASSCGARLQPIRCSLNAM